MTDVPFSWKSRLAWTRTVIGFVLRYLPTHFQPRRWKPLAIPEVTFEITSVCNSRCVFCPNGVMQRPRQAMKMDVFKKAVDDAVQIGAHDLDFFVTIGDPLLDPHLFERAHYIRKCTQPSDMGFNTTLQWLHNVDLDEFFRCGFTWIHVSTTLSGPETYRNFFGVDHYDKMLANLTLLLRENNRRGNPIHVEIGIKPTPEPRHQILNHPDFRSVQSLTTQNLAAMVTGETFLCCDWCGSVELPSYLHALPLLPRAYRPCSRLLRGLTIYSNGKVGACGCRDFEASSDLILGNVEDASLLDLWNGEHLARLRSDWRSGKSVPEACRQCRSYVTSLGGA